MAAGLRFHTWVNTNCPEPQLLAPRAVRQKGGRIKLDSSGLASLA